MEENKASWSQRLTLRWDPISQLNTFISSMHPSLLSFFSCFLHACYCCCPSLSPMTPSSIGTWARGEPVQWTLTAGLIQSSSKATQTEEIQDSSNFNGPVIFMMQVSLNVSSSSVWRHKQTKNGTHPPSWEKSKASEFLCSFVDLLPAFTETADKHLLRVWKPINRQSICN